MTLPVRGYKARIIALGYGSGLFFWLIPEDNQIWPVALLGAGLSALMMILWLMGKLGGKRIPFRYAALGAPLVGACIGLGASLATVGLMFFKNARHGHIYPDFPPGVMGAVLQRAPHWAVAGALAGLGLVLAWIALKDRG